MELEITPAVSWHGQIEGIVMVTEPPKINFMDQ
jgi:hypothetical protein